MPEIRFDAAAETVAVIDGYCSATGKCRTAVINALLDQWAKQKLHEARVVVRVAGDKPVVVDQERRK
ncbi:MAG: hypothetical protein V5B60_18860 [Accumulibacter sp.]|jgi:hypothetical protein|uniref:hypothetical protein n=1 Tax=Accumulibacter sp. TaxID=2053492 RepID=UPI002FC276B7